MRTTEPPQWYQDLGCFAQVFIFYENSDLNAPPTLNGVIPV